MLRHDDAWVMFYYGLSADGHARERVAFSDDLLRWEKADEVLIDIDGPHDSIHAHKPGVIARDGVLYHYYGAAGPFQPQPGSDVTQKDRRVIALATSRPVN